MLPTPANLGVSTNLSVKNLFFTVITSSERYSVWVRARPPAPQVSILYCQCSGMFLYKAECRREIKDLIVFSFEKERAKVIDCIFFD